MPLIRRDAIQGHATPKGYRSAHGPFPSEIFAAPLREHVPEPSDYLHDSLADVKLFRCKDCGDVLYENELEAHDCENL
jgi:hypothetical protein